MDAVNKTLYIPLYGKAYVSRKHILLDDKKAEEIWEKEGFPLKGKSASKWLAYSMGMRAAVFDNWLRSQMESHPDALVLHIGCGLDSRCLRVGTGERSWFDVDFQEVIRERRKYFWEEKGYRMLPADMREEDWKQQIPAGEKAIVVMEGVSMYFCPEELEALLKALKEHFALVCLLMDVYTTFGAKASKVKNPIKDVGVTTVYGMDDPATLTRKTGLRYVAEHSMNPRAMIGQLPAGERGIFSKVFAGNFARKLYRLYEFA